MASEAFRARLSSQDNKSVTLNLIPLMKEKIFSRIKEALGKTSFSERTLLAKAEKAAKHITEEAQITDEFIDDIVDEMKEMEGQFNRDVANAIKTQKKPGKKPEEKSSNPESNEEAAEEATETDDAVKKLLAEVEFIKAELQKEKDELKRKTLKEEVVRSLKEGGADNDTLRKAAMFEVGIDYEKSVEDNVKAIRKAYDEEAANMPEALPFFGGGGGAASEADREAERKARKEKILSNGRI